MIVVVLSNSLVIADSWVAMAIVVFMSILFLLENYVMR
jgi:hypothetical protein